MARQFDFDHYTIPNPELYEPCRVVQYVPGSNDPRQSLFLWIPKGKTSFPVAIWVHGGGMVFEAADPCDQLFDGTRAVAAVRYRLSPDHVAPAQHEDVAAAVAWIYRECETFGGNREKITLGGMSAGSYLSAIVAMDPKYLKKHGIDHKKLAGLFLVSGQMTTHFQLKKDLNYPGENLVPVIDEYAPLHHLSKDLPPMILITGQHDMDMPARAYENKFMADTLIALGHPHVESYELMGASHEVGLCDHPAITTFLRKISC